MSKDDLILQAIGEIKSANLSMVETNKQIKDNLKTLNDHNILHTATSAQEHLRMFEKIQLLTGKYWWLILALLAIILVVMGYKEAVKYVIPTP